MDTIVASFFVVDSVNVQIVVAEMRDGRKVAEFPFNPVKLFYPFDLASLCTTAAEQTAEQAKAGADASS